MTQFARPTLAAATDDGITLSAKFNGAMPALYSNHAGAAAPPSPEKGQMWVDTSLEGAATPVLMMKSYTGTVWRTLGTLDLTTGAYTVAGGLPLIGGTVTGPILFPSGTVGAPSISFSGDTDNGMYRVAADQIGFTTAGVQRILLTGTTFDVLTGLARVAGASAVLNLDRAAGTAGSSTLNFRTGTSNRWAWTITGVESTGNLGSNANFQMFDDAGALIVSFLQFSRSGRNMGINGPVSAAATIAVRSNDGTQTAWEAFDLMNTNTAADAYVGINMRTASGAIRSAIRGERPGGTNNGDLGIWTARTPGALTRAATFRANGDLDVTGNVLSTGVRFATSGDFANPIAIGWNTAESRFPVSVGVSAVGFLPFSDNVRYMSLGGGNLNILAVGGSSWFIPINSSDRKLKENIVPSTVDALTEILAIPTYQFDWKTGAFGPVADTDDVKPTQPIGMVTDMLPDDCVIRGATYEGVNLLPLVSRLIRAMQQQEEVITSLKNRMVVLEGKRQ